MPRNSLCTAELVHLRINDPVVRVYEGRRNQLWFYEGWVAEITPNTLKCYIIVDTCRMMEFDRQTGINIQGEEFGWLGKK